LDAPGPPRGERDEGIKKNIPFFSLLVNTYTGWWLGPTPLKNITWDDDIPNRWKKQVHVPKHQPVSIVGWSNPAITSPA